MLQSTPSRAGLLLALTLALAPGAAHPASSRQDDPIWLHGDPGDSSLVIKRGAPYQTRQRFIFFRGIPPKVLRSPKFQELIGQYSRRHGLDERLVRAVIEVESGYDPAAVSSAGAQGLMQIMPGTQKDLGLTQPFDPERNIEAGVRYLREQMDRFGSVELALAAYNAGPENVARYQGVPPFAETQDYVRKVLARMR